MPIPVDNGNCIADSELRKMSDEESGCKPFFMGLYNVCEEVEEPRELEPCPLCGSCDVYVQKNDWAHTNVWGFRCNTCDTEFKLNMTTMRKAIQKWNDRKGVPKRMCANCGHCSEPGCRSDIVCLLYLDGKEYYDVCKDWKCKDE